MKPIRIAVIGCGEIAQVMHLPYLAELPQFQIVALCDLSPSLLESLGNRYNVALRTQDYTDVLDEVEAVAVLIHDHTKVAVTAAEHGKHIFVEKPLSFSIDECDRILTAVRENGVKLMVGYMKRFDPGYLYALDRIAEIQPIRLVRLHDFGGSFDVHPGIYTLYQPEAPPADESQRRGPRIEAMMRGALGPAHEHLMEVYYEMLLSGSHDLTVLRGILGQAEGVLHSELLPPTGILTMLDYGEGRRCMYEEALMTGYKWWDQSVSVYGDMGIVSVEFPNPFVRYAPTVVTVRETVSGAPVTRVVPVSYDHAFRREWLHFADCVRSDSEPRTNGEDAKADVELAIAMVRAIR